LLLFKKTFYPRVFTVLLIGYNTTCILRVGGTPEIS